MSGLTAGPGPTITLALSKGRIFDDALPLLAAAGIEVTDDPDKSRKLILATTHPGVRVLRCAPATCRPTSSKAAPTWVWPAWTR